jgi:hypothetical protein
MRRNAGLVLLCGFMLPLIVAASASAQGAQLQVDVPNPVPGQAITVTGNFSGTAPSSDVQIHLNTRTGRLLTTTAVTSSRISATFPVPGDLAPGWYLLVATQTVNANGRQAAFSPGRTRIKVRAAAAGTAVPGRGRGGLPDSPAGLLAVGSVLLLLTAGATLTARKIRRRTRPELHQRAGV